MKKIIITSIASVALATATYASTIQYGPGSITTHVRETSVANDHLVVGNTDFNTVPTSFYITRGSLTMDSSTGPISFTSDGVGDGATAVYIDAQSYATTFDIFGSGRVEMNITNNYVNQSVPTYAICLRGHELTGGRTHVGIVDGLDVITNGDASNGINITRSSFKMTNSTITTYGGRNTNQWGSEALTFAYGSIIDVEDSAITTYGSNSHGISGLDSSLNANNLTINTSGAAAYGVNVVRSNYHAPVAGANSETTISNSSINTTGSSSMGIYAKVQDTTLDDDNGLILNVTDGTEVNTTGSYAYGVVLAGDKAVANISDATVRATGNGSYGVVSFKGDTNVTDSTVIGNASAYAVGSGGSLIAKDSDAVGNYVGVSVIADGHPFDTSPAAAVKRSNNVEIDGGTITTTNILGAAIYVSPSNSNGAINADITLKNGVEIDAASGVLYESNSVAGGTVNLFVESNTDVEGSIIHDDSLGAKTNVYIDSTSSWTMTENSTFTNLEIEGNLFIEDGKTLTLDDSLFLINSAMIEMGVGSLIKTDVFDMSELTSGKILIYFDDLVSTEILIADYDSIVYSAMASTDANDYFEAVNRAEGYFEFTDDFKLLYHGIIPEPSTYAAIFGMLALLFAIYRRQK